MADIAESTVVLMHISITNESPISTCLFSFNFDLLVYNFTGMQSPSVSESNDAQKNGFDLGAFVGDLTVEEDLSRYNAMALLTFGYFCDLLWANLFFFFFFMALQ